MLFELLLHHIPVYLFFSSQFLSSIRSNTDKLALYINKQQDPMGGPQTLRILQAYWDRLQMAAKAGGYPPPHPPSFHGYRGVTQGNPFPPTVFNMVVGVVIRHWVTVVVPMEAGAEGLGENFRECAAFSTGMTGWLRRPGRRDCRGISTSS